MRAGLIVLMFVLASLFDSGITYAQRATTGLDSPWKNDQLMQTQKLASLISKNSKVTIFNIGSVQDIKSAVHVGAASEQASLDNLGRLAGKFPKSGQTVLYCGCCPMEKCPNIRPAFNLLKSRGFTNLYVLDIPTNLRKDWIDNGFPLQKKD
ncbi:rhodanese-like domain-containing protein [Pedobacter suwonensis]|uniref:rhodanese-like domain-containing protein n=1 Tax=Pedobacter suwonensis TaxID=332999 RepID=UPI0036971255